MSRISIKNKLTITTRKKVGLEGINYTTMGGLIISTTSEFMNIIVNVCDIVLLRNTLSNRFKILT